MTINLENIALPAPQKRDLYFCQQVTQDTVFNLNKNLNEINKHDSFLKKAYALHDLVYVPPPITLYIDSYGGSVYQGLGVISTMESSTTPIHTVVTGVAMSCGFMIAISGHKRFAQKYATFMYHQLSSVAWGTLADMEGQVDECKRLNDILQKLTVDKTKISMRHLQDRHERKEDWFMSADEAVGLGVCDEILR